jgi:hypothetical protein
MKISHESPLSLLAQSRYYNDYDYALVHLFEENKEYLDFFKHSVTSGRHVILDNSIFELGTAFDSDRFVYWINELKPTEYIIPDVLEDSYGTMRNAYDWNKKYSNLPGKKIGVVQGKTYDELIECYAYLDSVINVDKLAISFDYSLYLNVCPHPNKWMGYAMGRVQTLSRLYKDGIINKNKPHHLLGCALPIEFLFYRNKDFSWLESLDTSNPVVHGLLDIYYEPGGLLEKQSIKLVDLLGAKPKQEQLRKIEHNIELFRAFVNGTR